MLRLSNVFFLCTLFALGGCGAGYGGGVGLQLIPTPRGTMVGLSLNAAPPDYAPVYAPPPFYTAAPVFVAPAMCRYHAPNGYVLRVTYGTPCPNGQPDIVTAPFPLPPMVVVRGPPVGGIFNGRYDATWNGMSSACDYRCRRW